MTRSLAKALTQISTSLPQIELVTILYPTEKMKIAVAELYAYIIRFLMRAQDWYQESRALHLLHSLTRPVELRYTDLMDAIKTCTQNVNNLASAGFQAEIRDVHLELQSMASSHQQSNAIILEMRQMMIGISVGSQHCLQGLTRASSTPSHKLKRALRHQSAAPGYTGFADIGLSFRLSTGRFKDASVLYLRTTETIIKTEAEQPPLLAWSQVRRLAKWRIIFLTAAPGRLRISTLCQRILRQRHKSAS